jgi:hypothetical protein
VSGAGCILASAERRRHGVGGTCCSLTATLALLVLVLHPGCARADADPASDVLLTQSAFYPYQPRVPPRLEATLNSLLSATARARLPLKVAIIEVPLDLGAVPNFFGHPQPYAEFLEREISFNGPEPLLVVMPAGFGLAVAGPASALARVPIDSREQTYGLTRSAILAVVALADASGHPVAMPRIPPPAGSAGGLRRPLLIALGAALLIVLVLIALRRRALRKRRRRRSAPPFVRIR